MKKILLFFSFFLTLFTSISATDFLWGVAISEYQNSGSKTLRNCNWTDWEKKNSIYSGQSNNHFNNYQTHIAALEELGCNSFRFSLEWSLIEPEEGVFDQDVINRYRKEITVLKDKGITPMLTMHHFTEPLWFTEKGGFEKEENIQYFEEFAKRIYIEYKDEVKYWNIINEPAVAAMMPYFLGRWPPQEKNVQKGFEVMENLLKAHVSVYKICKEIDIEPQIGFVHSFLKFKPYSYYNPLEQGVVRLMTNNWNESVINYFLKGKLDLYSPFQGSVSYEDISAIDSYDFVGVNYYSTPILAFTPFGKEFFDATCYEGDIMTDMPYHIEPEGFYDTLVECKRFKKPIYVTENGIADAKDDRREFFINQYIKAMIKAKDEGCDIRGYFYWTLFDNFEWSDGYEMKFGLFNMDKSTYTFSLKDGGRAYKSIIMKDKYKKDNFMEESEKKQLELYIKKTCPYCIKVLDYMDRNGIEVMIKDASIAENQEFLLENGKKKQVPCLFIDDKPLYESDDIIQYLEAHGSKNKL